MCKLTKKFAHPGHSVPGTQFHGKIKFVPQLFNFFIENYFTMLKFSKESF